MNTLTIEPNIAPDHVPESKFGVWFLGTQIWLEHVLIRAIDDLEPLIKDRKPSYPVILDVGCGWGRSLKLIHQRFAPRTLIGVDVDSEMIAASRAEMQACGVQVDLRRESASTLSLPDESVDLAFCHQTFHHIVDHRRAIQEIHRVLRPGGLLLFAESTRAYIHSWVIALLFRHAMDVQKSADEYLNLIRDAGFEVDPASISYPYLWWSRPDFGLPERLFGIRPKPGHEETLINLVAVRR